MYKGGSDWVECVKQEIFVGGKLEVLFLRNRMYT